MDSVEKWTKCTMLTKWTGWTEGTIGTKDKSKMNTSDNVIFLDDFDFLVSLIRFYL